MNRWLAVTLIVTAACAEAVNGEKSLSETMVLCSPSWERFIEESVPTGDGRGHGPDIGSDEWRSVVEFKLGIRDKPGIPRQGSDAWCHHIDQLVRNSRASSAGSVNNGRAANEPGPSFACGKVEAGSIEGMICGDGELSALDHKLSGVYTAASGKATNEHPPMLKAEQRGWIKGRNECWKSVDKRKCVRDGYLHRTAELQARYRLVSYNGPVHFLCDGNPTNEIVATFFQTDPPTLIAERGDSVSLLYLQPSGSGAKYQGSNVTFWEHGGEALITWGYGAPEMHCKKAP